MQPVQVSISRTQQPPARNFPSQRVMMPQIKSIPLSIRPLLVLFMQSQITLANLEYGECNAISHQTVDKPVGDAEVAVSTAIAAGHQGQAGPNDSASANGAKLELGQAGADVGIVQVSVDFTSVVLYGNTV